MSIRKQVLTFLCASIISTPFTVPQNTQQRMFYRLVQRTELHLGGLPHCGELSDNVRYALIRACLYLPKIDPSLGYNYALHEARRTRDVRLQTILLEDSRVQRGWHSALEDE